MLVQSLVLIHPVADEQPDGELTVQQQGQVTKPDTNEPPVLTPAYMAGLLTELTSTLHTVQINEQD